MDKQHKPLAAVPEDRLHQQLEELATLLPPASHSRFYKIVAECVEIGAKGMESMWERSVTRGQRSEPFDGEKDMTDAWKRYAQLDHFLKTLGTVPKPSS